MNETFSLFAISTASGPRWLAGHHAGAALGGTGTRSQGDRSDVSVWVQLRRLVAPLALGSISGLTGPAAALMRLV